MLYNFFFDILSKILKKYIDDVYNFNKTRIKNGVNNYNNVIDVMEENQMNINRALFNQNIEKMEQLDKLKYDYTQLKSENEQLSKMITAMENVINYSTNEQKFMDDTIGALEKLIEYSRIQAIDRDQEIKARQSVLELASQEMKKMDNEIEVYESLIEMSHKEKLHKDRIIKILKKQKEKLNDTVRLLLLQRNILNIVNTTLNLDEILLFIFNKLIDLFNFDNILFELINKNANTIKIEKFYSQNIPLEQINEIENSEINFDIKSSELMANLLEYNCSHFLKTDLTLDEKPQKYGLNPIFHKNTALYPIVSQNEPIAIFQLSLPSKRDAFNDKEKETLITIFSLITPSIKNALLVKKTISINEELQYQKHVISEDLIVAKKIINSLLKPNYLNIPFLNFFVYFKPLLEIGGDFFDIEKLGPNRIRFFLADAVGHGIQAALVTLLIKAEYDKIKHRIKTPKKVLEELNRSFHNNYSAMSLYFTCAILDLDLNKGKINVASASHPNQILIKDDKIIELDTHGFMIGYSLKSEYESKEYDVDYNDKLVLFTDGIYEEFSKNQEEFGYERFCETIEKHPDFSIKKLGTKIVKEVENWIIDNEQFDDLLLLIIEVTENSSKNKKEKNIININFV